MSTRRRFLAVSGAAIAGGVLGGVGVAFLGGRNAYYSAITEEVTGARMDAPAAHDALTRGEIVLVDIRQPEEWAATGTPAGAVRLDMRRGDFTQEVSRLLEGDRSRPVALICARGVRSARLSNRMSEAGFTNVIDVPEGMVGSAAGPGWIARGLPLEKS